MKRKHTNRHDRVGSSQDFANNEGFDNYEDRLQDRSDRGDFRQSSSRYANRPRIEGESDMYYGDDNYSRQGSGSEYGSDSGQYKPQDWQRSQSEYPVRFDQGSRYSQGRSHRDEYPSQGSSFGSTGTRPSGRSGRYETQYGAGSSLGREYNREDSQSFGGKQQSSNYWNPATSQEVRGSGLHAGKGPKNFRRSDERIREEVCDALCDHADIDASEVEVDVKDGVVTLTGSVDSRQIKRLAEESIENMSGVSDVKNEIRVAPNSSRGSASESQDRDGDYMVSQSNRGTSTGTKQPMTQSTSKSSSTTAQSGKSVQ